MAPSLIGLAGLCLQSQLASSPPMLRRMAANCLAVFVALRVGTRMSSKGGGLGMDDYITVFCVVVMLVTCILITIGTQYGLGRRMEAIDPPLIPRALKWNVIISSVLIWTFSLPKFAIIAILKRILNYGLKTTILFWGLAFSSQACILATSVWWYNQCDPVEFGWNRTILGGKCASTKVMSDLGYFTSAYSAFLDVFFAVYPIPFIMRLNMPLKNRILVSIALGLTILAFILTIYKLTIFGEIFVVLAENPTCELFTPHISQHRTNSVRPGPASRHTRSRRGLYSRGMLFFAHTGPALPLGQKQSLDSQWQWQWQ